MALLDDELEDMELIEREGGLMENKVAVILVPEHIDIKSRFVKDVMKFTHLISNSFCQPDGANSDESGNPTNKHWASRDWKFTLVRSEINMSDIVYGKSKRFSVFLNPPEDHPDMLVSGLPVKSPLYIYELKVARHEKFTKNHMGSLVWEHDTMLLCRKCIDVFNVDYFCQSVINLGKRRSDVVLVVKKNYMDRLNEGWEPTYEEIVQVLLQCQLDTYRIDLLYRPELTRYLFCEQINFLSKFYPERVILGMTQVSLLELYNKLLRDPFELFIYRTSEFTYRIKRRVVQENTPITQDPNDQEYEEEMDGRISEEIDNILFNKDNIFKIEDRDYDGDILYDIYIPEIDPDHLIEVANKLNDFQKLTIKIYNEVKDSYLRQRNSYIDKMTCMRIVGLNTSDKGELQRFNESLEWLNTKIIYGGESKDYVTAAAFTHTVLKTMGENIYMRESYLHTMCISECAQVIMERYEADVANKLAIENTIAKNLQFIPTVPVVKNYNRLLSHMCDEQATAFNMYLEMPIVFVGGKAGSGKTTLLKDIIACYQPGQIVCTAFMGKNAAQLATVMGAYSFTGHHFISIHKQHCWTENRKINVNEEKEFYGFKYYRCIYENVGAWFSEEVSMSAEGHVAIVFAILMKCSKLTKIIMCGDHNQKKPLAPGNAILAFRNFCASIGSLIDFLHCHRTEKNPGAALISKNADLIAEGKSDSIIFDDEYFRYIPYEVDKDVGKLNAGFQAVGVIKDLKMAELDTHIVARTRDIRDSINMVVDTYYRGQELSEKSIYGSKKVYQPGMKIVYKKNRYADDGNTLINGEILVIETIEDYKLLSGKMDSKKTKKTTSGEIDMNSILYANSTSDPTPGRGYKRRIGVKALNENRLKYIEWDGENKRFVQKGYATTVYGAQGLESDDVIFVMPSSSKYDTRSDIYTTVTRARNRFVLLGDINAFYRAIRTPDTQRDSDLAGVMIDHCSSFLNWKQWKAPQLVVEMNYLHSMEDELFDLLDFKPREPIKKLTSKEKSSITDLTGTILGFLPTDPQGILTLFELRLVCKKWKDQIDTVQMMTQVYKNIRRMLDHPLNIPEDALGNMAEIRHQIKQTTTGVLYQCYHASQTCCKQYMSPSAYYIKKKLGDRGSPYHGLISFATMLPLCMCPGKYYACEFMIENTTSLPLSGRINHSSSVLIDYIELPLLCRKSKQHKRKSTAPDSGGKKQFVD